VIRKFKHDVPILNIKIENHKKSRNKVTIGLEIKNQSKGYITMTEIITQTAIESRIHLIRGMKVMLDSDLSSLYEVETG
jgi:hypothetical protein